MSFPKNCNQRKLEEIDLRNFMAKCPAINGVFQFDGKLIKSDSRIKKAFTKVISTSPMLRSTITGSAPDLAFTLSDSKEEWPKLLFDKPQETDELAEKKSKEFNVNMQNKMMAESLKGVDTLQRYPLHCFLVRGETAAFLALTTPHHFMDGVGVATFLSKLMFYYLCPKMFWRGLDRRNPTFLPSGKEMVVKGDAVNLDEHEVVPRPDCFYFEGYNVFSPDARSSLFGIDEVLTTIKSEDLQECKEILKESNVTITSAFGALALKAKAILLEQFDLNTEGKPLSYVTALDPRKTGSWGNKKRDKEMKKLQFPEIANYAFVTSKDFPYDHVIGGSIPSLGQEISEYSKRLRNDASYRLEKYLEVCTLDVENISKTSLCYVNSMNFPRFMRPNKWVKPSKIMRKFSFDFAALAIPAFEFRLVTEPLGHDNGLTTIYAKVQFPIPNLTKQDVFSAMKKAAAGSPLEALLSDLETE